MKYTYKFRNIQNELNKQGLKMVVYDDAIKAVFFVVKNEIALSRHITLSSVIRKYDLDRDICIDVTESREK